MEEEQLPEEIKRIAMDFDNAIEVKDRKKMLDCFADDCEIELLGLKLTGKEGALKWIDWMFRHMAEIRFEPVVIMVEGNTFFEEFIVKGTLHNGVKVESKQAEVLIYEDFKIKKLKLYFDRLDFAESVVGGLFGKRIINIIKRKSLDGLI